MDFSKIFNRAPKEAPKKEVLIYLGDTPDDVLLDMLKRAQIEYEISLQSWNDARHPDVNLYPTIQFSPAFSEHSDNADEEFARCRRNLYKIEQEIVKRNLNK
jgi:hypothetical protein